MGDQNTVSRLRLWGLVPLVAGFSAALALLLGLGGYLLFVEISCPAQQSLQSSCYSSGFLELEKLIFLAVAAVTGWVLVFSGSRLVPQRRFLVAQWLGLITGLVAAGTVLLTDWSLWPLLVAFGGGLGLALWQAYRLQRRG